MPGYIGGFESKPSSEEVCKGATGHHEVVEVIFNDYLVDYRGILEKFFELHGPTGKILEECQEEPESVIFTSEQSEVEVAQSIIKYLKEQEDTIITEIRPKTEFWAAEEEHRDYYNSNKSSPPCTVRVKKFASCRLNHILHHK